MRFIPSSIVTSQVPGENIDKYEGIRWQNKYEDLKLKYMEL